MKSSASCSLLVCLTACGSNGGGAPPEHEVAAKACARISQCFELQQKGDKGVDVCTDVLLGFVGFPRLNVASVGACVAGAADCGAVGRCINGGQPADQCDPFTYARTCQGSRGVTCAGVMVGQDCAAQGLECLKDKIGQLWCGKSGACADSQCQGTGKIECVNTVMAYTECSPGKCEVREGKAVCVGEGEPCTVTFRCEGNTAVTCLNGRIKRTQCTECREGDGAFCTSAQQCTVSRCDGSKLIVCIQGVPHPVDCAGMGQGQCKADASGARCF